MKAVERREVPWWAVIGGLLLLLIAFNSPWFRTELAGLYKLKRWVFGLEREMNFAAWCSSALYLLSAGIFWEWAGREVGRKRRAYVVLSLLMLAIVLDEVASLHERLGRVGGWAALAPIGLVMALLLADALRILFRERDTRPVAWLVLSGFALMASVAGQEYVEHNLASRSWSEWWGRFLEEASELIGALVVLFGAVRARSGHWSGPLSAAVPDPGRMRGLWWIVIGGFVVHLAAAQSLYVLQTGPSRLWGNPPPAYPLILFLLLACHAYWTPHHRRVEGGDAAEVRGFWWAVGLFFLACSVATMQNLWGLFGRLVPGLGMRWFYSPLPIHLLNVAVVSFIGFALWRERGWRLLVLLGLPLVPWLHLDVRHPAAQFLGMGLFALLCSLAFLDSREPATVPAGCDRLDD